MIGFALWASAMRDAESRLNEHRQSRLAVLKPVLAGAEVKAFIRKSG